jgi:hypothetical protein
MKLHTEELASARLYTRNLPFEGLTDAQLKSILERGRELYHWYKAHPRLHVLFGVAVLVFLFAADYWVLMRLPRWFLPSGAEHSTGMILLAAGMAGSLHSYLLYSLGVYSMHEGAAHKIIFPPRGPIGRLGNWLASNACRLAAADPAHYTEHHMSHHAKFGTPGDGEFLNFVYPRRYWPTLAPFAAVLNYSDFLAHRPDTYTSSRMITAAWTILYSGAYALLAYREFGLLFTAVTFVVFFPHVGFYLDRMRQVTEHNLMPLENKHGSRSFGFGFWGLLLGGGPWGSPCHWEHHLVASLPWYQQLILHVHVRRLLTPFQRKQFLLEPVVGWPKLYWRVLRETSAIERVQSAAGTGS